MKLRAGYDIAFTMSQPTPMILMLSVHPSRTKDLLTNPRIQTEPHLPLREYRDMFGNTCTRVTAGPGQVRFSSVFDVLDSGRPDEVLSSARQHPIDERVIQSRLSPFPGPIGAIAMTNWLWRSKSTSKRTRPN